VIKTPSGTEWRVAETLAQPQEILALWCVHQGLCTTLADFERHFGSAFPAKEIIVRLENNRFVRRNHGRIIITSSGATTVEQFNELASGGESQPDATSSRRRRDATLEAPVRTFVGPSASTAGTKNRVLSFPRLIRRYFEENPDWLQGPNNKALIERFRQDYPGEEWTKKHQQVAANEKTRLRKKAGLLRRKRPKIATATGAGFSQAARVRPSIGALEQLELLIDDCLSLAARQNNPALVGMIKHLRVARRSVAWAMGEQKS